MDASPNLKTIARYRQAYAGVILEQYRHNIDSLKNSQLIDEGSYENNYVFDRFILWQQMLSSVLNPRERELGGWYRDGIEMII